MNTDGKQTDFEAIVRIDTDVEWDCLRNGGVFHHVLRQLTAKQ